VLITTLQEVESHLLDIVQLILMERMLKKLIIVLLLLMTSLQNAANAKQDFIQFIIKLIKYKNSLDAILKNVEDIIIN